ncbi:prenyltransferase/squalene oxidase repeat-containing protein [Streptomyces sp. MS2.AVA.5]|uniref:Prenyltransferase/squalene oxidase repeat-containing protein n=1 Tax=Streptomyces achmelvichensis TaxID=3134111 RepID=A0ACC6Q8A9_9ACTN
MTEQIMTSPGRCAAGQTHDLENEMTKIPVLPATDHVRNAHARLMDYVTGRFDAQGRFEVPCESRILESSLALSLLQAARIHPEHHERVRAYLRAAGDGPYVSALDRVLTGALLEGCPPAGPELTNAMMAGFDHFTAVRKRLLLETVLHVCGAVDKVAEPVWEAFEVGGLQVWKRVEMTACKAVLASARNCPDRVTDDDLALLAGTMDAGRIWEGNVLVHLMVLHALRLYPGHGDRFAKGTEAVLAAQRPDGGFSLVTDMDPVLTGIAGTALAEAHADPALLASIGAWLAARQRTTGSWNHNDDTTQTDVETSAFALETLLLIDRDCYRKQLDLGCRYLSRMQNTDGGVPVYQPGNPSEVSTTGESVTVWSRYDSSQYATQIDAGARFLIEAQHANGTYEIDWSASEGNGIMRATHALMDALATRVLPDTTAEQARAAVDKSIHHLLRVQNPDGGWGHYEGRHSDPISTAFALTTLGMADVHDPSPAAVAYLCAKQNPDGNIPSESETYSPRPLVIDFESLPAAYILRGLTLAMRGIERNQPRAHA